MLRCNLDNKLRTLSLKGTQVYNPPSEKSMVRMQQARYVSGKLGHVIFDSFASLLYEVVSSLFGHFSK